ncbi:MAG TPA: MFS transporter [Ancylobacter sp.]
MTTAVSTPAPMPVPGAAISASPRPALAVAALLVGSFLVGFDTRLFAIGLPDLRGAFGLSFDQGAWLNTFATAPQIFIAPAVAWLASVFGVRRVLFWPSLVYAAVSLVIPLIRNWDALVVLHIIRGLLLGVFIPATIMIIFRNLPQRWWVPAIAVYAFRLAFSQNTGLMLVGFYVETPGWQFVYWQDVIVAPVIGILALYGTPRMTIDYKLLGSADWGGMALLGTGWALIYAGLDQGNRLDWTASGLVTSLLVAGGVLVAGFFLNEALVREPWASHKVILSRNVGLGFLAILCFTTTSLSNGQLVPGFSTVVSALRPEEIGGPMFLATALPLLLTMPLAVVCLRLFDARLSMIVGFVAFAVAGWVGTTINHDWSPSTFMPMGLVQSVGQAFTFLATIIVILANSDPKKATAIAAYIQVLRLGGAEIATTLMTTWLRHREQLHSYLLGLHVPSTSSIVDNALHASTVPFMGGSTGEIAERGLVTLNGIVAREANVLSYIDGFQVTFWAAIAGLVVVALLKPAPVGPLSPRY